MPAFHPEYETREALIRQTVAATKRMLAPYRLTTRAVRFHSHQNKDGKSYVEGLGMKDVETRDMLADQLQEIVAHKGWSDANVTRADTNQDASKGYVSAEPYEFELTIYSHESQPEIVHMTKMAHYFTQIASMFPEEEGTPLEEYAKKYHVDEDMVFKGGAYGQVERFMALPLFFDRLEQRVVGHHTSKSISLPVVKMILPYDGTFVTVRDNFHDLCVSVDAKFPVANRARLKDLFNTASIDGYFEGFAKEKIFGPYDENHKQFSFTIGQNYPKLISILAELRDQDFRAVYPEKPAGKPRLVA